MVHTVIERLRLLHLRLGAHALLASSVFAAAVGVELIGLLAVWPLSLVGAGLVLAVLAWLRRRRGVRVRPGFSERRD